MTRLAIPLVPLLLSALVGIGPTPVRAAEPATPNIVFIMADDVGLGDIGLYHGQRTGKKPLAPTPNLDALARDGMRFSDAHSSTALCSPSRYCAMTGNLNHRSYAKWGVWGSFRKSPIEDTDATLGRVAKRGGLATGFVGKWHLGGDFRKADGTGIYRGDDRGDQPLPVDATEIVGGGPQAMGFDYSFTLPCGIQGPFYTAYENGKWAPFSDDSEIIHLNQDTALDPFFVSDKGPGMGDSQWDPRRTGPMLSDKARGFIAEQAGAGQPFFLCYWSPMVHIPHAPPETFDGVKIRGQTPTHHLDMLLDLDQQVGRIVTALKDAGVYENTLIVFSSDNGGLLDGPGQKAGHDSSGGFRGSKNLPYEGGHRVPFIAVWPGTIAAGSESHEPVAIHDVITTVAAVLGQTLNEKQAMDAISLLPLMAGETGWTNPRDEFLLQGGSGHQLIYRRRDWKLIIDSNHPETEYATMGLFNLTENPLEPESANVMDDPAHAERLKQMTDRYMEIRTSGARSTPPMAGGGL